MNASTNTYAKKKQDSPKCLLCGAETVDAKYTLFEYVQKLEELARGLERIRTQTRKYNRHNDG